MYVSNDLIFRHLFTDFQVWHKRGATLRIWADVGRFYLDHAICSNLIRKKRLEPGLVALLCNIGICIGIETTAGELRRDKVNALKHRPYTDYYDDVSDAPVRDRDRLICDLFSYELHGREAR